MEGQANKQQNQGAPQGGNSDVEKNKPLAIIGYIFPFLFFIPLVTEAKNSKFAKYHANQQLNLLLFWVVGQIAMAILSVIFAITIVLIILLPILWLAYWVIGVVLAVMGIINANKGEMKKLPIIGGIEIIK